MQRSTDRFLTTHTGSLPRPDDLIRVMYAKEEGVTVEPAALAARIAAAVAEVVRKQAAAGVDLINDGEMSKPSYATYIKDRLDGFGGTGNTFVYQDVHEFPRLEQKVFGDPGRSRRKTPACNGPIAVRDKASPQTDADNLKAAMANVKAVGGFMSAASPGVVSLKRPPARRNLNGPSALPRFEAPVGLVDHIDPALAPHNLIVAVAPAQGFQRVTDFHDAL